MNTNNLCHYFQLRFVANRLLHNYTMSHIRYYNNVLLYHRVLHPFRPGATQYISYIRYYANVLLCHRALDSLLPCVT